MNPLRLIFACSLIATNAAAAHGSHEGWSSNFTPVLIAPKGGSDIGGGVDPEVKYTLDSGAVRWSGGVRVGGYYAYDLFGVTLMPTLRMTAPIGPVEPYVSFGMGYGWLPDEGQEGIASMSRLGFVFRFSDELALGLEGTLQQIDATAFRFPSIGSMISIDL